MQLHAIAGLPRAGSTLLCNILNQRADAHATSTSCLPGFVRALGAVAADRIEFKNLLNRDMDATAGRFRASVIAFCETWHSNSRVDYVFDKSRGWNSKVDAFRDVSPNGKILLCVRDLRDVFASVEIAERKNGLVTAAPSSIRQRYEQLFSDGGVIGGPYNSTLGLIDRNPDNVLVVSYEELVRDPAKMMATIYDELGMPGFAHDFDNVKDTAIDPDGFYLGKFPHKAGGKIRADHQPHWASIVPVDIAKDIMAKASKYNEYFGYATAPPVNQATSTQPSPACAACGKPCSVGGHIYGTGHVCNDCLTANSKEVDPDSYPSANTPNDVAAHV